MRREELEQAHTLQPFGTVAMIGRRAFLKLAGLGTVCAGLFRSNQRKFPDDWTADEMNEFLYFRGLRPCPHSHHSSDEEFAKCMSLKSTW